MIITRERRPGGLPGKGSSAVEDGRQRPSSRKNLPSGGPKFGLGAGPQGLLHRLNVQLGQPADGALPIRYAAGNELTGKAGQLRGIERGGKAYDRRRLCPPFGVDIANVFTIFRKPPPFMPPSDLLGRVGLNSAKLTIDRPGFWRPLLTDFGWRGASDADFRSSRCPIADSFGRNIRTTPRTDAQPVARLVPLGTSNSTATRREPHRGQRSRVSSDAIGKSLPRVATSVTTSNSRR